MIYVLILTQYDCEYADTEILFASINKEAIEAKMAEFLAKENKIREAIAEWKYTYNEADLVFRK